MYRGLLFLRYSTAEQFNVFNPYTPNIRVIREIRVRFLSSIRVRYLQNTDFTDYIVNTDSSLRTQHPCHPRNPCSFSLKLPMHIRVR